MHLPQVLCRFSSFLAQHLSNSMIQEAAQLVGQKTFGKGLVQAVRGLADGSGMTVTIAKYLTPSGTDIHKNGIKPDVEAEMSEEEMKNFSLEDLGTPRDSQYKRAEITLIESLRRASLGTTYRSNKTNFELALR